MEIGTCGLNYQTVDDTSRCLLEVVGVRDWENDCVKEVVDEDVEAIFEG
jgi:hypothetical protein